MGGDADIDNFLIATRSNLQDLEAAVVQLKAKAVRQLFETTFVTGDVAVNAKSFDGLDKLTDPAQSLSMGANGGSLTLDKLDELVDQVKGGKPDILLMSRRSRRIVTKLARNSGSLLETDRDEFGQMLQFYDGIPIGVSDYIADNQTRRHEHRLLDHLRVPDRRGRALRPDRARLARDRTRRQPRDEGRHAHAHQVVRLAGAVQRAEAGAPDGREAVMGFETLLALFILRQAQDERRARARLTGVRP